VTPASTRTGHGKGLTDILRARVVVATRAQRLRDEQADRLPRALVTRRARDAIAPEPASSVRVEARQLVFLNAAEACVPGLATSA
jgi:hypothetical protein